MSNIAICSGQITVLPDNPAVQQCLDGWLSVAYAPPFDPAQIDPAVATALFSGGFALYVTPWATAWGLSKVLYFIRR